MNVGKAPHSANKNLSIAPEHLKSPYKRRLLPCIPSQHAPACMTHGRVDGNTGWELPMPKPSPGFSKDYLGKPKLRQMSDDSLVLSAAPFIQSLAAEGG